MTTRSKRTPKLLSLLLSTCMAPSMVPLSALAADGDITIDETNFPDANFRTYVQKTFDKDENNSLSETEIADVRIISVHTKGISSLKGVEHFNALTALDCGGNQLTELDVSKNTALTELNCGGNNLTQLDISKNTALTELNCGGNNLTQLDISKNTALTTLYCGSNQLTELDISNHTALTRLGCDNNDLTQLDISKNTALTKLNCERNPLTQLDISKNTALTELYCGYNQLTQLDVTNNPVLSNLSCHDNQLTQLDVSNNIALTVLVCGSNQLTSLDLTNNAALTTLNNEYSTGNKYTVNQRENITLPGNFDASKTSNVVGGKFDTTNNTFSFDEGVYSATYDYDVNYTGHSSISAGKFTLTYEAPEVPDPEPTEPEPTEPQPTEPEPTEPQPTENPFTDVPTDRYFHEPVLWAVANNITSGVSKNEFGPYEACTRAQIATFLWAAAGRPDPETTENPFTDVKESDYFYKSVLWAAENGITSGVSDTEFGPDDVCTRAQAVTLLWAGEGKPVVESGVTFSDVEQGDYFYDAVQWAVKNNVTAGIGDGLFGPYDNCQRGQIVTFMYKTFA